MEGGKRSVHQRFEPVGGHQLRMMMKTNRFPRVRAVAASAPAKRASDLRMIARPRFWLFPAALLLGRGILAPHPSRFGRYCSGKRSAEAESFPGHKGKLAANASSGPRQVATAPPTSRGDHGRPATDLLQNRAKTGVGRRHPACMAGSRGVPRFKDRSGRLPSMVTACRTLVNRPESAHRLPNSAS